MPVVRPLALYVKATYEPNLQAVVIPRTKMLSSYGLPTGFVFHKIAECFVSINNLPIKFEFLEYGDQISAFLPYSTIAGFRAAMLLPQQEHVMVFDELYALGMPLLLPSPEWMARLVNAFPYNALQVHAFLPEWGRLPGAGMSDDEWALRGFEFPPFAHFEQHPSFARFLYWHGFTNFATVPHVIRFDSIPGLLFHMVSLDLWTVHTAMKEAAGLWRQSFLSFWRGTVAACLGLEPAATIAKG